MESSKCSCCFVELEHNLVDGNWSIIWTPRVNLWTNFLFKFPRMFLHQFCSVKKSRLEEKIHNKFPRQCAHNDCHLSFYSPTQKSYTFNCCSKKMLRLSNFCHFHADTLLNGGWCNPHHRFCNLLKHEVHVFRGLRKNCTVEKNWLWWIFLQRWKMPRESEKELFFNC